MKKRLLSIILTLALCLSLFPTAALAAEGDVKAYYDDVDANGNIIKYDQSIYSREGPVYTGSDGDATFSGGTFYIIQGNITIGGNLTIANGRTLGGVVLCKGATLTVTGALIHTGDTDFYIYGQSDSGKNAGRLIIKNSKDNGAAIRSTANNSQLGISSGALELHGGSSGQLIDKVRVYSTTPVHKGTLNDKPVPVTDWEYNFSPILGQKLVIEYCKHDNADNIEYISDGSSTHHKHCKSCGFTWKSENCDFNGSSNGYVITAEGHASKCVCGNVGAAEAHNKETVVPAEGNKKHSQGCSVCGYASDETADHDYNTDGKCTICYFKPVATDSAGNLYDDVNEALEAAANGNATLAKLETHSTGKTVNAEIDFDQVGKSATLVMNGYTLQNQGNATLKVENGTLTVTGDATLVQNGTTHDLAAPAVRVTGGTLIFNGKLTATGGSGKRAVEVTDDGTLTLKEGDVLNGGVSVEGSDNYENVNALLGENLAFAEKDNPTTIVDGRERTITGNLTVVEHKKHTYVDGTCACGADCPHSTIDDATGECTDCRQKFAAKVNDYLIDSTIETAIGIWLKDGGTMKLYASGGKLSFDNAVTNKSLIIDLNGYNINKDQTAIKLNGANLTIQDSREKTSSQGAFGPIVADSGALTLEEGGYLQGLNIPNDSTATVTLKGGKVQALNCPKPVYTLMPDGYALMNGNLTVDPTKRSYHGDEGYNEGITYTIKNTQTQFIGGEKSSSTAFGSQTIPFALRLKTDDIEIGKMSFEWYRINSDGAAVKLAGFDQDMTPDANGVYTFDAKSATSNAEGWNGMTAGNTYNVMCVVIGKESSGAYCWQTVLRGYELTVTPASIENATVEVADNLTYDGTQKSPTVTVKLDGKTLTEGTDYTVSGNTGTNAGKYSLTVEGMGNYGGTATANWSIAPKTVEDATVTVNDGPFTYKGAEIKPTVTVKDGETVIPADEYTVSYEDNINAGSATVKVTSKGISNHTFNTSTTFTIGKAAAPMAAAGSLSIVNDLEKTYTVNLAALLPTLSENCGYGEVTYGRPTNTLGEGTYVTSVNSKTGELTLKAFRNKNEEGQFGTITVPVTTTNYNDITLTIDVSATNKIIPAGTPSLSKDTITYGEALSTITLSGSMKNGETEVPGMFAWAESTVKPNAGEYQAAWTFTPNDTEMYQETSGTATITVNKATPTGEPKYTAITTSGKKLSDAGLTVNENWPAGTVKWVSADGADLDADTEVKANTAYKWVFTPTSGNYNPIEGSVTLYHVSSGGGSSRPSYSVNTPSKTENGSVSLSTKNASQGSTVTLTVQPDSGYVLEKLTVTDKNGKELTLTDKGDGKYSFVMPAGAVEIKASFTEEAKAPAFDDVSKDAYYYEAVQWAQEKGITDGISEDLFGPNQPCTRAQIVTFLWRAAGSPAPKGTGSFADVPAESYYAQAVAWAVENGVTTGTGEGTFSPNAPCDRAQSVTFLYRAAGSPEVSAEGQFGDVAADAYYAKAVAWAAANGITTGTSSTTFSPNDSCTRAQIATFLYRTCQGK